VRARQPWMKFYPSDWQSDLGLRSCSAAARGLWMEMICIMQQSAPVGFLTVNGRSPDPALLSVLCGIPEKVIKGGLAELLEAGVYSVTDDGVIYSRRLIRDAEKAETDKANGGKGGNPRLKAGVNPQPNPRVMGVDKAHIPEARSQKEELSQGGEPLVGHSRGGRA